MQEDDDPVVQEIPVYLSKLLAEKLFLFQFPVRPSHVSYDDTKVIQSCIKPQHQEVKLELELDTQSSNYDTGRGEQIAWNVDGKKEDRKAEDKFFKNDIMDKQLLQSTRALADTNNYAVAVYHDNELHITPLRGIVHLRPSFSYLDKSDKRAKEEAKEQGEADASGEEEEEVQQVTVKFARQENERIKRARERSFGYLSKKSAEEPWYYTEFYNAQSEKAELERGKLYCTKPEERVNELSLGVKEYMKYLIPKEEESEESKPSEASAVISLNSLKQLPIVDQVKILFREAKILRFSHLVSILEQSGDIPGLLRTVQQVAVLVQGNWVVRSDVLYPKDSTSSINGVPAELMCRGRDYILYLFTQNRHVDRVRVSFVIKLPSEETREILDQIARLKVNKRWELQLPFDKDFISRYPEVVQRQQMWWDAKQKQLSEALKEGATGGSSPGKSRRKSNRDSSVSDNELSGDGRPSQKISPKRNQRRKSNHRESFSSDNESGAEGGVGKKQPQNNCASGAKIPRRTNKQSIPATAIKVEPMET
ncbi:DNA-directed RNA polymerase III subunit RPC5 [Periplaneta americana]|uniref:DNA-directed RNA polymerase III subunit RPC5 n=1 Tax=Periplaneta americana TaxID=6978 RepID=UPI0037E83A48